jgi:hypothetical protein
MSEPKVIDVEFEDMNEAHDKPSEIKGLFHNAADALDHAAEPLGLFDEGKALRARQIAMGLRATANDAQEAKEAAGRFFAKSKSIADRLGITVSHNAEREVMNLDRK